MSDMNLIFHTLRFYNRGHEPRNKSTLGSQCRHGELFLMRIIKKLVFVEFWFSHGPEIVCVIIKISLVVANYFFIVYIPYSVYSLTSLILAQFCVLVFIMYILSCQDFHDVPLPRDLASTSEKFMLSHCRMPKARRTRGSERVTHETLDEGVRIRMLLKRHGEIWFEGMYWIQLQVRA
jgi:hypothetical protein